MRHAVVSARARMRGVRGPLSRRAPCLLGAAVGASLVRRVEDLTRHSGLQRQREALRPVGFEGGGRPRRRGAHTHTHTHTHGVIPRVGVTENDANQSQNAGFSTARLDGGFMPYSG